MMVECDVKPGESETLRSMRERHNSMVHTSVTTTPWCGDTVFILIGTLIIIMLTHKNILLITGRHHQVKTTRLKTNVLNFCFR